MGEKFTTWADPPTGIQPFVPYSTKLTPSLGLTTKLFYWTKQFTIGIILSVIRFPIALVLLGLLFTLDAAFRYVPIGFIRRSLPRLVISVIARLLLLCLGFWWIKVRYLPSKKKNPTPSQLVVGSHIGSGHVIFTNYTSYVELLYLTYRYMPQFTVVGADGETLIPQNLWQAFKATVYNVFPKENGKPLDEMLRESKNRSLGPVVVFPEGTTTNGKVLLGCLPVIKKPIPKNNVHLLAVTYDFYEFSPTFTVGNWLWHMFRLCGQLSNKMDVRYVIDADLPEAPNSDAGTAEWGDSLFSYLANAAGVRRAQITRELKKGFIDYWYTHKKLYKVK